MAGILLLLVASRCQDASLGKEAIERAAATPTALRGISISLTRHSGDPTTAYTLQIRGDGVVTRSWPSYYPIRKGENRSSQTLRLPLSESVVAKLVRSFSSDEILRLPAQDPWPTPMRYSIELALTEKARFAAEINDIESSKRPPSDNVSRVIKGIQSAVDELQEKIATEDAAYLSSERLKGLLKDNASCLSIELRDIQGLFGGESVLLEGSGEAHAVYVRKPTPGDPGFRVKRQGGKVEGDRCLSTLRLAIDQGVFEIKKKQRVGVPDEATPEIELKARVDGVVYSRSVWLFETEAESTPPFARVREALRGIARALEK